jgi:hypothetical protein
MQSSQSSGSTIRVDGNWLLSAWYIRSSVLHRITAELMASWEILQPRSIVTYSTTIVSSYIYMPLFCYSLRFIVKCMPETVCRVRGGAAKRGNSDCGLNIAKTCILSKGFSPVAQVRKMPSCRTRF